MIHRETQRGNFAPVLTATLRRQASLYGKDPRVEVEIAGVVLHGSRSEIRKMLTRMLKSEVLR